MKEARFFYVPNAALRNDLPPDEAQHAVRVLRLTAGDEVFLMDGEGTFYAAELSLVSKNACMYHIKETLPQEKTWNGRLHLAVAPTKMAERMEWLIEKSTEIGIDECSFLNCAFSERRQIKGERIERIMVSAMKQSRKAWIPVLHPMQSFNDFIQTTRTGRKFIAHCYDEIEKKDFFDELSHASCTEEITIMIGPEGDFSIDEVRQAQKNGFESVTLGAARLRTETAALSAVMMAQLILRKPL